MLTKDALADLIHQHRESYDRDCGWHMGCQCGTPDVPEADNDDPHKQWTLHLADVILQAQS